MERSAVMLQCSQLHSLHLETYHKPYSPAKDNRIVAVYRGSYFELVRRALCKAYVVHCREGYAESTRRGVAPGSNYSKENRDKASTEREGES